MSPEVSDSIAIGLATSRVFSGRGKMISSCTSTGSEAFILGIAIGAGKAGVAP